MDSARLVRTHACGSRSFLAAVLCALADVRRHGWRQREVCVFGACWACLVCVFGDVRGRLATGSVDAVHWRASLQHVDDLLSDL